MTLSEVREKLKQYLGGQMADTRPRLVNVNDVATLAAISENLRVLLGDDAFLDASSFDNPDYPIDSVAAVHDVLVKRSGATVVTGLSSTLLLHGQDEVKRQLDTIVTSWSFTDCRVIVLVYRCAWWIEGGKDKRHKHFVYNVESASGKESKYPSVTFVSGRDDVDDGAKVADGVAKIAEAIEQMNGGDLFVVTRHKKIDYPNSIIPINDASSAYSELCRIAPNTQKMDESLFDDGAWRKLLHGMRKATLGTTPSWKGYANTVFETLDPVKIVKDWGTMDSDKKRLFFAALRLGVMRKVWAFDYAALEAKSPDDVCSLACRAILQKAYTDKDYWARYEEHKRITKAFDVPTDVSVKGDDALYYMTANTFEEKKAIITFLCEHADVWGDAAHYEETQEVLSHVYSDLAGYLDEYIITTGDGDWSDFITQYFHDYKVQKLFNCTSEAFIKTVEEQAVKRDYVRYLPSRASVLSGLDKKQAKTLFIDALGVEYLAFIKRWCEHNGLAMTAKMCRCELPSITSVNKPLLTFDNGDTRLDEVKHEGAGGFDYTANKMPVHLARELKIIADDLLAAKKALNAADIDKVYIVSDHGASRLAVIHEGEKHEMSVKGEHSGRCCPVGDIDKKPDCAIEENGWYVLCNYDRFSGSRKAQVETHGGATLEEVAVSVITIMNMKDDGKPINVRLVTNDDLAASKSGVTLPLWSNAKLLDALVRVADTSYSVDSNTATGDAKNGWVYKVQLPDIKKSDKYSADVIMNGEVVATLKFKTHTKGMGSVDDMGI